MSRLVLTAMLVVVATSAGPSAAGDTAGPRPDFDGDGFADLAASTPGDEVDGFFEAGSVHVLYGTSSGPSAAGNQRWTQNSAGVPGVAQAEAFFGHDLTWGDFDADGFDDLAASTNDQAGGSVTVLYGSPAGLSSVGAQIWDRSTPGVPGEIVAKEGFGHAVRAGDFDADGHDDLVIGIPHAGARSAGEVLVLPGRPSGVSAHDVQRWTTASDGLTGPIGEATSFGTVLAVGDLDGNGHDDLAVGSPNLKVDGAHNAGGVWVLYSDGTGLTGAGSEFVTEATPGIPGVPEAGDWLAQTLSVADLSGDGVGDLAVEVRKGVTSGEGGAVLVINGTGSGLDLSTATHWHEDLPGVPGADASPTSASRVTTGDFNGDGWADMVIGSFSAFVDGVKGAGTAIVFYGTPGGLTTAGSQRWSQNSPGIAGTAEEYDYFGEVYAFDANGDGVDDLAIGAQYEDVTAFDEGVVHVLLGGRSGVTAVGSQLWWQGAAGILGQPAVAGNFGFAFSYR